MNYEEIKNLINYMGNAKINELDIEFPEGMKISMKKNINQQQVETSIQSTISTNKVDIENNVLKENSISEQNYKTINSPMVGTFYKSLSPDAKPFVKVGDKIKKGQVICIVEAMKLMNEIESEFDGEIVEICVDNEAIVEYGMPLFKIK